MQQDVLDTSSQLESSLVNGSQAVTNDTIDIPVAAFLRWKPVAVPFAGAETEYKSYDRHFAPLPNPPLPISRPSYNPAPLLYYLVACLVASP